MKKLCVILIAFAAIGIELVAGEIVIEPPPEGKVAVYMGRMTGFVGRARPFHFFHDQEYLGILKGKNYYRVVCEPGENLFWVAAENRTFVTADLEAGKTYAIFARIAAGTWSAGAQLQPITRQSEAWAEFGEMITGKPATPRNQKYLDKWAKNHPTYVEAALKEWELQGKPALSVKPEDAIDD